MYQVRQFISDTPMHDHIAASKMNTKNMIILNTKINQFGWTRFSLHFLVISNCLISNLSTDSAKVHYQKSLNVGLDGNGIENFIPPHDEIWKKVKLNLSLTSFSVDANNGICLSGNAWETTKYPAYSTLLPIISGIKLNKLCTRRRTGTAGLSLQLFIHTRHTHKHTPLHSFIKVS